MAMFLSLALFLCLSATETLAQFGNGMGMGMFGGINPLLLGGGEFLENFAENGYVNFYNLQSLQSLNRRVQALEAGVRTGAIGGCESGVIGPLSSVTPTAVITFARQFAAPPAISLAVSDISSLDPTVVLSFQIRPTSVSTSSATVTLIDGSTPANVASLFVSYMACPSNSAAALTSLVG